MRPPPRALPARRQTRRPRTSNTPGTVECWRPESTRAAPLTSPPRSAARALGRVFPPLFSPPTQPQNHEPTIRGAGAGPLATRTKMHEDPRLHEPHRNIRVSRRGKLFPKRSEPLSPQSGFTTGGSWRGPSPGPAAAPVRSERRRGLGGGRRKPSCRQRNAGRTRHPGWATPASAYSSGRQREPRGPGRQPPIPVVPTGWGTQKDRRQARGRAARCRPRPTSSPPPVSPAPSPARPAHSTPAGPDQTPTISQTGQACARRSLTLED